MTQGSMLELLHSRAVDGRICMYDFVDCALFGEALGYYKRSTMRVGRNDEADFYTASSLGPLFRELVACAAQSILGEAQCQQSTFIEIGAEPEQNYPELSGFKATQTYRLGDTWRVDGSVVLFSNELFDAQPFDQVVFDQGTWKLTGATLSAEGLIPCIFEPNSAPRPTPLGLPENAPEGYIMDVPTGAENLLQSICTQNWKGLFIAFDYGKDWADLTTNHPEGTARAYTKHRQHNAIWESPGEQDITHHICWDRLETILAEHHFSHVQTQRQEAFLIQHATKAIEQAMSAQDSMQARRTLMELLHPGHMGAKFQVLTAQR